MVLTKEVVVGQKKYIVRELLGKEVDSIDFSDKNKSTKEQVILSTGMTASEYDELTFRERLSIIKQMNILNGLDTNFLEPTKE